MKTNIIPLHDTPPTDAEGVSRMLTAARAGGEALARRFEENARLLADEAAQIEKLGDAVPVGVRETARQLAVRLRDDANRIQAVLR